MIALIASLALMWFIQHRFDILWNQAFRGLSLVLLATMIGLVVLLARRARAPSNPPDRRLVIQLVVATFALLLLGKMFLNVLLLHYGFALAMPAALVTIALVASWWPNAIDRAGGTGAVLRATAVSAVGLVLYIHLHFFHMLAAEKVTLVGTGADAFWADAVVRDARGNRHEFDHRGRAVNHVLDALAKLPRGATLAAVPEGTMINFLSRRPNPTPYVNLMPPEVLMFGQERILRAYQQRPPDYIVLVLKSDPADYGYKSFARDYGKEIYGWIEANYRQVPVPTEPTYPMVLLERK
jgi:hypothetical protein